MGVVLRTNNQVYILEQLGFLANLTKHINLHPEDEADLCLKVSSNFEKFFSSIPQDGPTRYH